MPIPLRNGERLQRISDINERLRVLTLQLGVLDEAKTSPERSADMAAVLMERDRLRAERDMLLADPAPQSPPAREEIMRMWAIVSDMRLDWDDWRREENRRRATEDTARAARQSRMDVWMIGISAILFLEFVLIVYIVAHVF